MYDARYGPFQPLPAAHVDPYGGGRKPEGGMGVRRAECARKAQLRGQHQRVWGVGLRGRLRKAVIPSHPAHSAQCTVQGAASHCRAPSALRCCYPFTSLGLPVGVAWWLLWAVAGELCAPPPPTPQGSGLLVTPGTGAGRQGQTWGGGGNSSSGEGGRHHCEAYGEAVGVGFSWGHWYRLPGCCY